MNQTRVNAEHKEDDSVLISRLSESTEQQHWDLCRQLAQISLKGAPQSQTASASATLDPAPKHLAQFCCGPTFTCMYPMPPTTSLYHGNRYMDSVLAWLINAHLTDRTDNVPYV